LWLSLSDRPQMIGSAFDQNRQLHRFATMKLEEENKKKR
jgi:hypothetical protein